VLFIKWDERYYTRDLLQNYPGRERVLTLESFDPESDAALVQQRFPGAALVHADIRGSLWRISP
jgi:hypothetical protein